MTGSGGLGADGGWFVVGVVMIGASLLQLMESCGVEVTWESIKVSTPSSWIGWWVCLSHG